MPFWVVQRREINARQSHPQLCPAQLCSTYSQEDKNIKCSHTVALHYIHVPSAALSIWLLVTAKSFTSFRRLFSTHLGADLLRKVFCLRLRPPEHSHSTALHAVPQPGLSPSGLQCLPTTSF